MNTSVILLIGVSGTPSKLTFTAARGIGAGGPDDIHRDLVADAYGHARQRGARNADEDDVALHRLASADVITSAVPTVEWPGTAPLPQLLRWRKRAASGW